ncbi:hypothetical protein BGW36DRAFT_304447 [Talaromyces proteolyticus]|uniref:Nucleoside phosphorylase domain-containing protein n=1 Tax=Talaromyces proteolyticus TaxID=1131652 RepID=A0AAD4KGV9_9EURO|nr:uncharacterized protein BGW36DRAFT_304447 [Talaromyces proteolyticus]KAH8692088.1 hypothetical protein BGW36DRAFT_304447 [Talaromyces proteolyticus]
MSHFNISDQKHEFHLMNLVADVSAVLGEGFKEGRHLPAPLLYRDLRKALATTVLEIKSVEVVEALGQSKTLQHSLKQVAKALNNVLRWDYLKAKYQQFVAEEANKISRRMTFLPSWLTTSSESVKQDVDKWANVPYPRLEMLRELSISHFRGALNMADFLCDERRAIINLTDQVKEWNDQIDQIFSGESLDDDNDLTHKKFPKPIIKEAAFCGKTSIRHLSQTLYETLHQNLPCRFEDHDHNGRLGVCEGAKFCLDPQWSYKDADSSRDSFFVLLTGPDMIQECRVYLHASGVGNNTNTLVCLVDHEISRAYCLQLSRDKHNQLWDQQLAQQLETLQPDEQYIEKSLGKLLQIVKPTYAAKRVLGVILARSMLHLLDGPWIRRSLNIDDISLYCKLQNDQPYPFFDKVFLSTSFKTADNNQQVEARNSYSVHPFPTILALGIVLAEIELGEELDAIYNQPAFTKLKKRPFDLAKSLLRECELRFHLESGLLRAVKYCIDRTSFLRFTNTSNETLFADQEFVNAYYMSAVRPLEEDLVNGAKWTWNEVGLLQRRNLDDEGVCKTIIKLGQGIETSQNNILQEQVGQTFGQTLGGPMSFTLVSEEVNGFVPDYRQDKPRRSKPPAFSRKIETKISNVNELHLKVSLNQNTSQIQRPKSRDDFEIAIICALPLEANAVLCTFDQHWDEASYTYGKESNDRNSYSVGVLGGRNVVLAHQPGIGKVAAASVAASCATSFKNVKLALVVGVCGSIPLKSNREEILLGDVVISKGVVQYDLGRQFSDRFRRKISVEESLGRPNASICSLLAKLETATYRKNLQDKITDYLNELDNDGLFYPEQDMLFKPSYRHKHQASQCCTVCENCINGTDPICEVALESICQDTGCDEAQLIQRRRQNSKNKPMVHIGLIGSGDMVVKSGTYRDMVAKETNVIAFDMEGAGVWDTFPCVIIKGVCDYADSHKNKLWQEYAAATAAACAKGFIRHW